MTYLFIYYKGLLKFWGGNWEGTQNTSKFEVFKDQERSKGKDYKVDLFAQD